MLDELTGRTRRFPKVDPRTWALHNPWLSPVFLKPDRWIYLFSTFFRAEILTRTLQTLRKVEPQRFEPYLRSRISKICVC